MHPQRVSAPETSRQKCMISSQTFWYDTNG